MPRGGVKADSGIVTRGDGVASESPGAPQKVAELDRAVAMGARNGRSPLRVLPDEVVQHRPSKLLLQIQDVERNPELVRDLARIQKIAGRAATAKARGGSLSTIVELERDPDQSPSLLMEE